ncbi:MAG: T9SS type A sorting domain-containing protein, partial [Bacteroidota bacterium]
DQQVLLSWEAAGQTDVSYYLVERRINGEEFLAIGGINVSRVRQAEANLRFIDQMKRRKDGLYVYRVKQVMKNGLVNYSPELSLVRLSPASVHVYNHPDPAYLNLEFAQQSFLPYQVMLIDLAGNVKFVRRVQSGETPIGRFELPVANLAEGMYLVRIEDATQTWVQRILIR